MNLWEQIKYGVKVFLLDPVKAITDPENAVLAYSVKEKIAEGESVSEVKDDLREAGFVQGSVVGNLTNAAESIVKGLEFATKALPYLLLIALVGLVAYYTLPVAAKIKAAK